MKLSKDQKKSIYEMQAKICAAMAHPTRLQILDLISEKEMNSTELLKVLEISKANLSQHLTHLKKAGLLQSRREGTCSYVSLAIPKLKNACSMVQSVLIEKMKQQERDNMQLLRLLKVKVGG